MAAEVEEDGTVVGEAMALMVVGALVMRMEPF